MWFFNSPRIVFGEESISWLRSITGTRAFIVTDENIVRLGFVHRVMEELAAAGIESEYFSSIEPDPSLDTVVRCAQAMSEYSPDLVIGVGGGSCLDAAKGAWFLYERPDILLEAITPFELFGLRSRARLITIPTTSGTGSDVSWGFSLSDKENHGKLVRVSYELIPDLSIVDPSFTQGLSPQSTADTGMDVLSHAIEAYTCSYHNDFADGLALKAIQLVFDYLPRAYQNGSDNYARERMHNAATIAGLAFSNTAVMLAHALAHGLSGSFSLPHGRLVGLFTPYTIEYNADVMGDRYGEICRHLGLSYCGAADAAYTLAGVIRDLAGSLHQPVTVKEMGILSGEYAAALPAMINYASNAPELGPSPRIPYEDDILKLYEYAYIGSKIDF